MLGKNTLIGAVTEWIPDLGGSRGMSDLGGPHFEFGLPIGWTEFRVTGIRFVARLTFFGVLLELDWPLWVPELGGSTLGLGSPVF